MKRARLLVATGLGVGYAPVAPGTAGAALGVLLAFLLGKAGGTTWGVIAGTLAACALGAWSCRTAVAHFGRPDPPGVVIDEIAGQLLALVAMPHTGQTLLVGFVLFRLFDIVKPPPLRRLEKLPGASGIMADDLAAGLIANLLGRLILGWWNG